MGEILLVNMAKELESFLYDTKFDKGYLTHDRFSFRSAIGRSSTKEGDRDLLSDNSSCGAS